ncbi:hypothetical protein TRFO_41134 [Tritrichomonas foetus]|uniref:BIG2 domain-containing protein n=1 Tax=Tritrichomonas foetus TaxID=1144522 RepID=A0A1J4L5R3_9EUKA|nr:hypothetical protein TRFO_41134 [Tritrichomonas foetus]|eukprot:OHT17285.1 hypothetical protein TRFO_41134 [Tritrichomonas foetus]
MLTFFLLPLIISSKLKMDECQIRLPFRNEGSSSKPFCIQTASNPNVEFEIVNPEIATIEYTKTVGSQTIVKIVVEHTGPNMAATILIARWHDEILSIPVYVDKVDRIEIRSILDVLYVKSYCMFKLFAYNSAGLYFSSLDGVDVEWSPDSKEPGTPFTMVDVASSPFKTESSSLPNSTIIIHPTEVSKVILKAKLVDRDVPPAERPLQFVNPIIFHPAFYCLYPGATAQLKLYQAKIDESNRPVFDSEDKRITLGDGNFVLRSSKNEIASVNQLGFVETHKPGLADITARDEVMILSEAHAVIRVTYPTTAKWPEQWIKIKPEKPEKDFPGPYEPDVSTIELYYHNNMPIDVPENLPWVLSGDDYTVLGDHNVVATLSDCNFQATSLVHTCKKPQIGEKKIKKIRIPINHDGYPVKVFFGSGYFKYTVEDPSIITLTKDNRIITHKIGKTKIKVEDLKLPGYKTKLKVVIQELTNLEFSVIQNELYVNDKVQYTFHATTITDKGKVKFFDYVMPNKVEIEDETIISKDLVGLRKGFTKIRISIGNVCSQFVTMNVFNHITVQSVIHGTSHKWLDLKRAGGPVVWPQGSQRNELVCGNLNPKLNDTNLAMMLYDGYDGECTLTVQNDPSDENPNPIKAEIQFNVVSTAIAEIGLFVTDAKSANREECHFVESRITNLNQYPPHEVRIPVNHTLNTKLYAFSKDGKNLGEFNSHSIHYDVVTDSGEHLDFDGKTIVTEGLTITVTEPTLPEFKLRVNAIPPHYISQEDEQIVLYHKNPNAHVVDVKEGSGLFTLKGVAANIEGRTLSISPSSDIFRTVSIYDKCIPENILHVNVTTERIDSLLIEGPDYAVVGQHLTFTTTLFGPSHMKISSHSTDMIQWTSAPSDLQKVKDNIWEIVATKPGRLEIDIAADDIHSSHSVTVFDKMSFPKPYITMFVGDREPLKVIGGPETGIVFTSNDTSVVDVGNNKEVVALSPGNATVIATIPEHPEMGSTDLHIRVINVAKLVLEQSIDKMYVGSYVHLQPFYITDMGKIPPPEVSWTVSGNDQWEKLYDNSLMIQGDKEGMVTVTATTPHKLSESKNLYFDYLLRVTTPQDLNLPVGSSYKIEIENSLPVHYNVIPLEGKQGAKIDENGLLTVTEEGKYIVIVQYNKQWTAVHVTVSVPPKLYLQSLASSTVRPHLLDPRGQEYTAKNDIALDYNVTFEQTLENESVIFSVPTSITDPVYAKCEAHNKYFTVDHTARLFPRVLIHPQSPVLMKGASVQFICYSKNSEWQSLNDRVVSLNADGVASALKQGKTNIQCSSDVKTSVTVVELETISLQDEDSFNYRIVPHISGGLDPSTLTYPSDITYRCEWDAKECGRAVLDKTANSTIYCRLELFKKRLCPIHSTLKVECDSVVANTHLEKSVDVKLNTDTFGISSTLIKYINNKKPFVEIPIKPSYDEVSVEADPGLNVSISANNVVKIEATTVFKDQGDVVLEHKVTGERVRITIIRDSFNLSKLFGNVNMKLFGLCAALFLALLMYVTYQIGRGGLLIPVSPTR